MKKLIIISLITSVALWAADVATKNMGKWGKGIQDQPTFEQFDVNNDGKITPQELKDGREERRKQNEKEGRMMRNADKASSFSDIDKNDDGVIDKNEFRVHKMNFPQGCVTFMSNSR